MDASGDTVSKEYSLATLSLTFRSARLERTRALFTMDGLVCTLVSSIESRRIAQVLMRVSHNLLVVKSEMLSRQVV